MKKENFETYEMDVIDEALTINEFNLYWKYALITEDLFYFNFKNEFNWVKTLNFISNKNKFTFWQCNDEDTKERSYKIKIFLKELPTYGVLYQREVNAIANEMCPRCNNEIKDWYHVWKCERNEVSLEEILYETIAEYEEILISDDKKEEVEILRDININFYEIMLTQSDVLLGYYIIWELLRGVYNRKFDEISKKKEYKNLIEHLWNFCYDKYRKRI
ncbi:hypothetical protein C1646_764850 [Rhizophagus diaphanus]|nr:hypothetical protein C1646_764850 [Rhizophagus diaphanus] [Rhizophagus sp. MUCL 43196]